MGTAEKISDPESTPQAGCSGRRRGEKSRSSTTAGRRRRVRRIGDLLDKNSLGGRCVCDASLQRVRHAKDKKRPVKAL